MLDLIFGVWEDIIASIYHNKLLEGQTFLVVTVSEPAETVFNLGEPWSSAFPLDFLDVFYCVKSEVDSDAEFVLLAICSKIIFTFGVSEFY